MATASTGAGIGGAIDGSVGNITIINSDIEATSTMGGSGIGSSGFSGTVGNITITNSTVVANSQGTIHQTMGDVDGVGIGGRCGLITITGGHN
jgi:hypothetical protein